MAEYNPVTVYRGFNVCKIPSEVSYEEAATLDPLLNSLHAIMKGKPSNNEVIVIYGAGTIGLGIVQCLKALEIIPKKLIMVDLSDYRLIMARQLGADVVINASDHNPVNEISKLVGSRPMMLVPFDSPLVDVVFECVGHTKEMKGTPIIQQALNMLHEFSGRIVLVGLYGAKLELDLSSLVAKQTRIIGSFCWYPSEISSGIELMETKKINRLKLISHEFSLDRIKEAFELASNVENSLKVLIKP
jgi:threonine dehydrogenase-like Zn-dependent dehydrogenase